MDLQFCPIRFTTLRHVGFVLCVLLFVVTSFGCQRIRHPWAGAPYQHPSLATESNQKIFSPTPKILPPQIMQHKDTEAADREIEKSIFGINNSIPSDDNVDQP